MGYKNLPAEISSSIITDSNIIKVTVTSDSPKDAFDVASAILENYNSVSDYISKNALVTVLEEPRMCENDVSAVNYPLLDIGAFFVTFGVLVVITAYFTSARDTIRNSDQVREKLNVSLLASLPNISVGKKKNNNEKEKITLITDKKAGFYFIENIKKIRSKVEQNNVKGQSMSLIVTSILPGEGKTTVAANLAVA